MKIGHGRSGIFLCKLVNNARFHPVNQYAIAPSSSTFRFPKPSLCRLSRSIIDSQRHLHFPSPNFLLPAVASPSVHTSPREISRSPRPRYPSQNRGGKAPRSFLRTSRPSSYIFHCPSSSASSFLTFFRAALPWHDGRSFAKLSQIRSS